MLKFVVCYNEVDGRDVGEGGDRDVWRDMRGVQRGWTGEVGE